MLTGLKKSAYTLLELVIVIVIIVLITVFAIPAFSAYGKNQAFEQKIDEAKQLMAETYTLSKNPEKDVMTYELTASADGSKFILKKCFDLDPTGTRCTTDSTKYEIIKTVDLLKGEIAQDTTHPYLACLSAAEQSCIFDSSHEFSLRDSNVSSGTTASFTISAPFNIAVTRRD